MKKPSNEEEKKFQPQAIRTGSGIFAQKIKISLIDPLDLALSH